MRRFRDWGYAAAIIQFVGATMFSVSVIIALPHVLPSEASTDYWTWDATFWTLQVRASACDFLRCCLVLTSLVMFCDSCNSLAWSTV